MPNKISKILLASDGSEGSLHAARFAAILAGPHAAHITIVTVHSEDSLMMHTMGPAVWPVIPADSALNIEEIKAATEKQATDTTLADTKAALDDYADVDTIQIWGHTADTICTYAKEEEYDLIVIGSRGHSAVARLLLGSSSTQVAQHAPCPVTIVR